MSMQMELELAKKVAVAHLVDSHSAVHNMNLTKEERDAIIGAVLAHPSIEDLYRDVEDLTSEILGAVRSEPEPVVRAQKQYDITLCPPEFLDTVISQLPERWFLTAVDQYGTGAVSPLYAGNAEQGLRQIGKDGKMLPVSTDNQEDIVFVNQTQFIKPGTQLTNDMFGQYYRLCTLKERTIL